MKHDNIVISLKNGVISHLYDDALLDLDQTLTNGRIEIRRASHVEPNKDGKWEVTLITGEILPNRKTGLLFFDTHAEAIEAEVNEINNRIKLGTWGNE